MEAAVMRTPMSTVQYKNIRNKRRVMGKRKIKEKVRKLQTAMKRISPKMEQP
jgi:hypothetical protein